MFFIGRLLFLQRTLTGILDGECGGDHHGFPHRAVVTGFQHHPRQARVNRQFRQLTAGLCQMIMPFGGGFTVDSTQFFQQFDAILDIAFIRRFHKREGGDIPQPDRGHLQNNGGQVGTQNFRVGKFRP